VAVAESAIQADTRSVCVMHITAGQNSTDTERRAGLSAIAELVVLFTIVSLPVFQVGNLINTMPCLC